MLDDPTPFPEDPEELRAFTARLLAEVKTQAALIEKLRHQLAGHRAYRFGASSETAEQSQLALETSEIAAAAMSARLRLPDVGEKGQPKCRPIPNHVPRMEVELAVAIRYALTRMPRMRPYLSPRCPRARSIGAVRGRASWPMFWSANMPIICRSTVRARSLVAKGSPSTAPRWPTGSARRLRLVEPLAEAIELWLKMGDGA